MPGGLPGSGSKGAPRATAKGPAGSATGRCGGLGPDAAPPADHDAQAYAAFPDDLLGDQEEFYEPESRGKIRRAIAAVIEKEGPISETLLLRRVAAGWDFARVGGTARKRILDLVPARTVITTARDGTRFYWPEGKDPAAYRVYRTSDRRYRDIAPQEIANAAFAVVKSHTSVPRAELARAAAKALGFRRITARMESRMDEGVAVLLASGRVIEDGPKIVLPRGG